MNEHPTKDEITDRRGWTYTREPQGDGDCRKLVWLEEGGVGWVGIRAWNATTRQWLNGGEPERAHVLCWQDLPKRPLRFWLRGKLVEVDLRD